MTDRRSPDVWHTEIETLRGLGRTGAAFDHALRCADEGSPVAGWLGVRWVRELAQDLRPVQLTAFRLDAIERHGAALPSYSPSGGRAWFPAVYRDGDTGAPAEFAPGALGLVIAREGRTGVSGTLSDDAITAVQQTLDLLRREGLLSRPVSIVVRAPRDVAHRSLQLAVAAAAISAAERLPPLDDVAFTGALSPDGEVLPVLSIPAKRRVLDEEWPGAVLMVPPDHGDKQNCAPVATLLELLEHLRGTPTVGWNGDRDPAAVRAEITNLRESRLYIEASRLAWSLARRETSLPPELEVELLTTQLHEANNTGAQARAIRLAEALTRALPAASELSPDQRGEALSSLARHDSSLFRLADATRRSDEALALPLSPETKLQRLRARARVRVEDLDLSGAIADAEEAARLSVEVPSEHARSEQELGEWRRRAGDLDRARAHAAEAERLNAQDKHHRGAGFATLLKARIAMDEGDPTTARRLVEDAWGPDPSPGIELFEVAIAASLALGDRDRALALRDDARRRYYGALRGSVIGRMLALRQDLLLAEHPEAQALARARIWRLPGFRAAYAGRIPDTTDALLTQTPY